MPIRPRKDPLQTTTNVKSTRGAPAKHPTTTLSVRIETTLYDQFYRVARERGYKDVSEPVRQFIRQQAKQT